jgi:hypothetical protein
MTEEPRITASSNPTVAKRHGLTHWDRDRGQWVRPPEPEPEAEVEADDYDTLTAEQLRTELGHRDLATSGNKQAMIDRLREDDAADRAAEQDD